MSMDDLELRRMIAAIAATDREWADVLARTAPVDDYDCPPWCEKTHVQWVDAMMDNRPSKVHTRCFGPFEVSQIDIINDAGQYERGTPSIFIDAHGYDEVDADGAAQIALDIAAAHALLAGESLVQVGPRLVGRAITQAAKKVPVLLQDHERTALDSWAAWGRAAGHADRTISERRRVVEMACGVAGEGPLELSVDGIVRFLGRPMSQSTRVMNHSQLKAWHRFLTRTGRRLDDPMVEILAPRTPRREPHPVSTQDLRRLLASRMHRRLREMILLAAYQGLRVHEVAKVRGEDVDVSAGMLRVKGKGGVTATLPLHPDVAALAESFPRDGWWFPSYGDRAGDHVTGRSVGHAIALAMGRIGIRSTAHSLRHWYGTELVRSGADLRTVQTLMRHSNLNTTAVYTQVADEARVAAVLRLPSV